MDFEDPIGVDHGSFSEGLRKSLFNYMQGVGLDLPLKNWFDFKIPSTSIPRSYIGQQLEELSTTPFKDHHRICWLGSAPILEELEEGLCELLFSGKKDDFALELPLELGHWLYLLLKKVSFSQPTNTLLLDVRKDYEQELGDFEELIDSEVWEILAENGLLVC